MISEEWLAAERARLLDFAEGSLLPTGGFGWLGDDGRPDPDRPLELWITCRMTHVFALAHLEGRAGAAAYVDHGIAALTGLFHDDEHGGWFAQPGQGAPGSKTAYEHAFVVLAASSAAAAGRPGAETLLAEALAVLDEHFWDDEHGMVVEEWSSDWSRLDGYRGVNANMHTVEALLAAADVTGDDALRERALRITTRVVGELAPAYHWRIPEHFDADWSPQLDYHRDEPAHPFRPYGATIGHWLEWARLALHLEAALGQSAPVWLAANARSLLDAAVREGWAVDEATGFVYTVDFEGQPVVRQRMHWVVAEGILTAHALGDDSLYQQWWQHVVDHFRDLEQGSWRHELGPDLRPSALTWAGKPDVYHAYQAALFPTLPLAPSAATALARG